MSLSHTTRGPFLPRLILRLSLPASVLEAVLGDLEEEFRSDIEDRAGPVRARAWYWKQCLSLSLVYLGSGSRPPTNRRREKVIESIWNDVRYGVRNLRRSPGFVVVAVLTLALGIGANTAIFSVLDAVVLRPLPIPDADRIVRIYSTNAQMGFFDINVSYRDFIDWRDQNDVFELMAARAPITINISGVGGPERSSGAAVTEDYFDLYGTRPLRGRTLSSEDFALGAERVAVLAEGLWKRRFGSDPFTLGSPVNLNGTPYIVVGIVGSTPVDDAQVWIPLRGEELTRRNRFLNAVAKRRSDVTLDQVQSELAGISVGLEQAFPESNKDLGVRVTSLQQSVVAETRTVLFVLLGAVGFVLLIGCANVANLVLTRIAAREKELTIRRALGAGPGRLMRQLLVENVALALLGGVGGLLAAYWGIEVLVAAMASTGSSFLFNEIGLNPSVLAFTAGVSTLTILLFGLFPAALASRRGSDESLNDGTHASTGVRRQRLRGALAVAEVALALTLLVGAGLLMHSVYNLTSVELGFRPDNLFTMRVTLPRGQYSSGEEIVAFYRQSLDAIRKIPGARAVGATSHLPIGGNNLYRGYLRQGDPVPVNREDVSNTLFQAVDPGYIATMEIPVFEGRAFSERDNERSAEVALINRTLADRLWPAGQAVGNFIRIHTDEEISREIVGVVADVTQTGLDTPPRPHVYVPYSQSPFSFMTFVIRHSSAPDGLAAAVQRAVSSVDDGVPIYDVRSMDQRLSGWMVARRGVAALFVTFAGLAFTLACLGIYGVISYGVSQRSREIGIRVALGARSNDIVRMVVGQGMKLTALGLIIGTAGGLVINRLSAFFLFHIGAVDPITFISVTTLFAVVGLVASYLPARRALKCDPVGTLRLD